MPIDQNTEKILQETKTLEAKANNQTLLIARLNSEDEKRNIIASHIEELENTKAQIMELRKSVGLFYSVWKCDWNGETYKPENVVSPKFDFEIDANSYRLSNCKDINQNCKYVVCNTTENGQGGYVGYY